MENRKIYDKNDVLTLPTIKITKWENYKEGAKYRKGWIEIPFLTFESPSEIDRKIPSGTTLQNVRLRINTSKNFVALIGYKIDYGGKDKLLEEIVALKKEIENLHSEINNLKKEKIDG